MIDAYNPAAWHDFFLAAAGAAAALTGLLFVGLSLHVRYIASSNLHRNMARGSLIGLVLVLIASLIILMPESPFWMGLQLVGLNLGYIIFVGGYQLSIYRRMEWRVPAGSILRQGLGITLALFGVLGGVTLAAQSGGGLYIAALVVTSIVVWNLRNAWALLMGVVDEDIEATVAGEEGRR
jgi:hypothetical protein